MTSFEVSPLSGSPAIPDNSTANTSPSSAPTASGLSLAASAAVPPAKPKGKPRKRVNTAEKRNQHNAIERQRRETLNGKFISLARLLPSLAAHRRPSKSAIVNGSIAHLTHQREQRLMAARLLRQLCAERDALAKECAEWRYASGLPARDDLAGTSAWSDEMEEICNVEKEQFGTFAGMEDGAGDDNDNEAENEEDGDDVPASSYGGSFSYPSLIHPPVQQQQAGEMSLEQAAAVAAQASFRASASSSAGSGSALGSNMNGLFAPNAAASLFGGNANPWGQMSLQDLQAFAVANASTGNNGMTTPGANGNGNGNGSGSGMADMFAPASMSSSTASLPFNAFMSDDSVSPGSASNSGYSHVPTPPQTSSLGAGIGMGSASAPAHAFMASLPTVQHTPSPGSSHSFDDAANLGLGLHQAQHKSVHPQPQSQALPQGQWTEQQLMLLRALQQQQQQQQQQAQAQQQGFNPLPLSFANNAAAAFALGLNGNGNGSGNVNPGSSPATADSPFSMFASMLPPQQQQKSATNPLYSLGGSGNGNGMGNLPPPPPLTRAQTENLEAWRKLSAMPNPAYRTPVGMGMSFDQLQQAQSRAVEGF